MLPRDTANVNALKYTCGIFIFAFFNDSIESIAENNIKNVKTHLKPIEIL